MKRIIGISAPAKAGKDTAASYLCKNYGMTSIAFADPIKRAVMDWYGFSYDSLWGPSDLRNIKIKIDEGVYLSPREACQEVGTGVGRRLCKSTWVNYGIGVAKKLINNPYISYKNDIGLIEGKNYDPVSSVIISDARYTNEMMAIKNEGGFLLRIKRNNSGLNGKYGEHSSELEHLNWSDDKFDFVIDNNSSYDRLYDQLDLFAKEVLKLEYKLPKQLELFS